MRNFIVGVVALIAIAMASTAARAQALQITRTQTNYTDGAITLTFETNIDVSAYSAIKLTYQIRPGSAELVSVPPTNVVSTDKTKLVFTLALPSTSTSVDCTLHVGSATADVLTTVFTEDTSNFANLSLAKTQALKDATQNANLQKSLGSAQDDLAKQKAADVDLVKANADLTNTVAVLRNQIEPTRVDYDKDVAWQSDDTIIIAFTTDRSCLVTCTCTGDSVTKSMTDKDLGTLHKFKFTGLPYGQPYKFTATALSNLKATFGSPLTGVVASLLPNGQPITFSTLPRADSPVLICTAASTTPLQIALTVPPAPSCEAAIEINEINYTGGGKQIVGPVSTKYPVSFTTDTSLGLLHGIPLSSDHFDVLHAGTYEIKVTAIDPKTQRQAAVFDTEVKVADKPAALAFSGPIAVAIDPVLGTTLNWQTTVAPAKATFLLRLRDSSNKILGDFAGQNVTIDPSKPTALSANLPVADLMAAFTKTTPAKAEFVVQAYDSLTSITPVEQAVSVTFSVPTPDAAKAMGNTPLAKATQTVAHEKSSNTKTWQSLLTAGLGILLR